jgi:integrase
MTFGDFMTSIYLPQCELDKKPNTYRTEKMFYHVHMAGSLADLPLNKVAPFHLEKIKKAMADKKKSDRTIEYILQMIRQAFNKAKKLGFYHGEPPTLGVKWPKLDNMKMRYLSIAEAETLLAALAAKSQSLHDMALLSLNCGLRFGEIAALTWSCVNFDAGTLAILNAKTGSRTAYLTDRASAMLKARERGRPDELIFPKRSGKDGAKDQASRVFTATVNELKLNDGIIDRKQKITFHSLRHSYATYLYESTHDLYLTQRSLGHATGTMTARYAKMSEPRLREGAAALEKAFTANGKKEVISFNK